MIQDSLFDLIVLKFKLRTSKNKAIAFGLYLGEIQFLKNIISAWIDQMQNYPIVIAHEREETYEEFMQVFPSLKNVYHIYLCRLNQNIFSRKEIKLYMSSDANGLQNIYSIYSFHGQPSKGLTFSRGKLDAYDALFLYGPLQKEALEHFVKTELGNNKPDYLSLYEIGYTKSDDVINGCWKRNEVLKSLELPVNNSTVLYAPAFNKNASLRNHGLEIIKELCSNINFNVIAKLPVDCLLPTENEYPNGGVNWFIELSKFEKKYVNFRLYKKNQIDPVLEAADVLVTCVSSVSFEFLALNKPVVFLNTPKFYSHYLKELLPNTNMDGWEELSFINGGKEFGIVVDTPQQLEEAIYKSLHKQEKQSNLLERLLYNPGKATDAAIEQLKKISMKNVITSRPPMPTYFSFERLYKQVIPLRTKSMIGFLFKEPNKGLKKPTNN